MMVRQAEVTLALPAAAGVADRLLSLVIVDPAAGEDHDTVGLTSPGVVLPAVEITALTDALPVRPLEPVAVTVQVRVDPAVSSLRSTVAASVLASSPSSAHSNLYDRGEPSHPPGLQVAVPPAETFPTIVGALIGSGGD